MRKMTNPKQSIRLDPRQYPRAQGESWWIVNPNTKSCSFTIPSRAITACLNDLLTFKEGTLYDVREGDLGWVEVNSEETYCSMPQYVFARYFDAEAFIIGSFTREELERAIPFDYKPSLPMKRLREDFMDETTTS